MKKIKTKILLGFGATTTLLTAGSVVLSCGNSDQDQSKLNAVTAQMVADYLKTQPGLTPSIAENVPAVAPITPFGGATLNQISGLTITISNWKPDKNNGSVTFDASISKVGLTTKAITGVTYDGWATTSEQQSLNAVTHKMVADFVKTQTGFTPLPTVDAPATAPSTTLTNVTLNGLSGLTIAISNWKTSLPFGSVTFDASISKTGLATKTITEITYDGYQAYGILITHGNATATENKLWSWDDSTNTLNIFDGVTEVTSYGDPIAWGTHDITSVAHINFPNTLTKIGNSAFADTRSTNLTSLTFPASLTSIELAAFLYLTTTSITFEGSIPGTGTPVRPNLNIAYVAFGNTAITSVVGNDWQAWINANCPTAFKQ